jgi:hypothetical protein
MDTLCIKNKGNHVINIKECCTERNKKVPKLIAAQLLAAK